VKNTTLLEGAEESWIVGSKYKEVIPGDEEE